MNNNRSEKRNVLVIDAENETSNLIKLILNSSGEYEVWRTNDPKESLVIIESENIDLVLCECFDENTSSFEICETIQENKDLSSKPAIIFYADRHDQKSLLKAFEVGAVDYLLMPSYPMEFKARVNCHSQLKRQRDLIIEKMSQQKELIHIMCHDINGPVGVPLQLMTFAKDEPHIIIESLDSIINSLSKAIDLTDMVRQLQAVEDGKKEWNLEPLDLRNAVEDSASVYAEKLKQKEVQFSNSIDEGIIVQAEKVSFVNSVVSNLLSNSIKFSKPGAVISASAQRENGKVVFAIKDEGIGMPESIANNLFNLKVPTSREGTQNEKGTGYGMPLVKKFVLSYGGELEVISKDINDYPEDHGTEFKITLQSES